MPRFLNRILGIPSKWQRRLFDLFSHTLESLIRQAKREMSYDQGNSNFLKNVYVIGAERCGDRSAVDLTLSRIRKQVSSSSNLHYFHITIMYA